MLLFVPAVHTAYDVQELAAAAVQASCAPQLCQRRDRPRTAGQP